MMIDSSIDSTALSQEAIRARWGVNPTVSHQTVNISESWEQVIQHLKDVRFGFHKSVARAKAKCSLLRKRMRNITLYNVVARIVPFKNQTSRSHQSTTKSVKSTSPSGSSDGSDPDPETVSSSLKVASFKKLLQKLIQPNAFFAHIFNNEVAK
ncbi:MULTISPECIES: hypothetical protein [Serratia]|uniref:Uncharacterized protein n=1 Tax=Serratia quinivorans TaxID=137545 RepID=A0A379YTU5_9GAMM|nr:MULTISPECIES: hypothetical protein [Serratia]CAI1754077.1 Uncharacterised protein [Serratia quinivorans]SUI50157.1 Uncharacterised protein [Serratia quinivorans]